MKLKTYIAAALILIPALLSAKIYKGAEYRTKEAFTYGRFEVRMKSAQKEGMLSSFFTYHEITTIDDWNEIDIEIMGRYSDDVQFNPITRGQVNHVSHYQTPFNPALDFHTYAFEWAPAYVAWFVDGKEVHRATGAHIEGLNLPQKIMMNVWNPAYANWAGEWNENVLPAFAYYDWVSYSSYTPGAGTSGTDSNFTLQWKDDFDAWDQTRWEKATHTFGGNNCDFVQSNAVFQDGKLILCLTKETAVGYTDIAGPSVLWGRAEPDGIRIEFSEELDSVSATKTSNYILSGKTISSAVLLPSQKTVKVSVAEYDTAAVTSIVVMNVKDRSLPSNTMAPKSVTLIKSKPLSFPVKINCAGPAYQTYRPDQPWGPAVEYGYIDGSLYTNTKTISGTTDPLLFNTELNGMAEYRIRVPNGSYVVVLMMSENFFTAAGKRVFTYSVNGKVVEQNLDLYKSVGMSKAYQKSVSSVAVTDGMIDIHFMAKADNGLLNGIQVYSTGTSVGQNEAVRPEQWKVGQNFPNPFNGGTVIPVDLGGPDNVTIRFYDTLGRKVSELAAGEIGAGEHFFHWNAKDLSGCPLATGIYYFTVSGKEFSATKKLVLLQ